MKVSDRVRIIEGELKGCYGILLSRELSPHGPGKREWICSVKLTESINPYYFENMVVKLWDSKLERIWESYERNKIF